MKSSTVRAVVVVLVLALVLSGVVTAVLALRGNDDSGRGGAEPTPTASSTPDAGATEPPDPALAEYYSQRLDWQPCDDGDFECATLTVPLDYDEPDGETIDLALLKVPAGEPGERVGSLVVNPGGPGSPGTDYAAASGQQFRPALTDRFDVVGFDPRGTGDSAPVDCLTDEQLDAFLAADPEPDTDQEVEEFVDDTVELAQGCEERSGDLADHVSTVEAARDMDVLRAALGESTLTYLGASYGTALGATYAELFPDRVGRLVLDGAVDVSLTSREKSLGQARGFETALRSYVDNCLEGGNCYLGSTQEEALDRIVRFLDEVDADPLPTSDGRELAVGNAFLGIITPLYVRDYWSYLDEGLQAAFKGDGSILMLLADAYASRGPNGYQNNSAEAIYAINCLDDPSSVPASEVPSEFAAFEEASPTFGRVFAWGLVGCLGFEVREAAEPLEIRGEGAAPIVVTGTTRDPATPYEWAQALADQLESGVLVTRDGDGHTAYNSGNECIDEALEAYLVEGTVPEDGLTC